MTILYVDDGLVACVKPVGLDAEHQLPDALREQLGGEIFPIHRLDRGVGGVMVYARTKETAAALSRCVQDGTMIKEYVALVHGEPPETDDWEDLLFKDSRQNKVYPVKRMRKGVKEARLTFERLTAAGGCSLVAIRLYTGRTHQIRVQFASRGFPLVGDRKYGAKDNERDIRLFSRRVTVPYRGETRVFEAVPPFMDLGCL